LADLRPVLDGELSRLPAHHRAVVLLCDLEGKSRQEAAAQLGVPEGTVASRLARARAVLAGRLSRRGVVLSGASLGAMLAQAAASAGAPPAVKVASLTKGVMQAMLLTRLKTVTAGLLVALAVGAGAGAFRNATRAGPVVDKARAAPGPLADRPKEQAKGKGAPPLADAPFLNTHRPVAHAEAITAALQSIYRSSRSRITSVGKDAIIVYAGVVEQYEIAMRIRTFSDALAKLEKEAAKRDAAGRKRLAEDRRKLLAKLEAAARIEGALKALAETTDPSAERTALADIEARMKELKGALGSGKKGEGGR
jgi:hypothetical protein